MNLMKDLSYFFFQILTVAGQDISTKREIEELLSELGPIIDNNSQSSSYYYPQQIGADVTQKNLSKIGEDYTNAANGNAHIANFNYKSTGDLNQQSPKEVVVLQNASNRENNGFIHSIADAIIGGDDNKDTQT